MYFVSIFIGIHTVVSKGYGKFTVGLFNVVILTYGFHIIDECTHPNAIDVCIEAISFIHLNDYFKIIEAIFNKSSL